MAMNKSRRTSNINNIVQYDTSGNVTLAQIPLASTAAAHVIISDNRAVKYRTVAQFYGDLGFPAQTGQNGKILSTDGSTLSWIANAGITALSGDVTATGPGSVAATIPSVVVTGKTLTGLSITGTAVTSSDSILIAIGKLQNQVNGLTGTLIYKGSWNAATNTPAITSGVGVAGNFYIVTVAGSTTIDGISSWAIGDWIIFSGSVWQKVPNTNTVTSVNTYTGAVVLKTDDIAESATPTNLWFTNTLSRNAISLTTNNNSGAATYTAGTGVFNIPNYTLAGLGGFANPMSALGDIIYGGASGVATRLAGNTAAAKRFLIQTGDGTISAAPSWGTIAVGDVPTLNQNTTGSAATLTTGRLINGVSFNGSADITITANTTNAITFNNGGEGAASGTTFNGSAARTVSYNTIGAQGALTLTTTGSGAATLVGNTLNIPTPSAISTGNLTEATSSVLTITGGTGAVVGAGTSIQVKQASSTQSGFLSSTDWSTFNEKQNAFSSQTANTFYAAPNGAAGVPGFRGIVAADIPTLNQNTTGSAATLTDARTLTIGGTGKTFDGSANVTWTLAEVGALSSSSTSTQSGYFGDIYLYDDGTPSHYLAITNSANLTAARILSINVNDANRTISLDGNLTVSAAATISGTNTGDQTNITGNAGTATKLETARAINGVNFDGSAAITITANTGTSLTFNDGGAGAASGTTFNGGTARTISYNTIGAPATDGTNATGTWGIDISGQVVKTVAAGSDANWLYGTVGSNDYFRVRAGGASNAGYLEIATSDDGTEPIYIRQYTGIFATIARTATILDGSGNTSFPGTLTASNFSGSSSGTNTGDQTNISGNAGTATALQNARTITVGATGRSFNGTADISWSLADIGAQAAGSYVTTNTYQNITGYKEFASYGSGNKTGFLCNNATTGFMFMQNVSTGKTWDWEILSNGTLSLNESGVSARLQLFAAGGGRIFGNMTADAFFEASDIRYKDVIHTNPVVDLSSIDVIKYKFTDDLNGQVRYGYSAQSIQAVLPELVQEKDERLYLNYSDVHTLKIAALEKRVKELELKLGI